MLARRASVKGQSLLPALKRSLPEQDWKQPVRNQLVRLNGAAIGGEDLDAPAAGPARL